MFNNGIRIGDRVSWVSSAGALRGEITNIRIGRNAKNELVPWINIEYYENMRVCSCTLCGTEDNLSMMKFKVNFRDNYRCNKEEAA